MTQTPRPPIVSQPGLPRRLISVYDQRAKMRLKVQRVPRRFPWPWWAAAWVSVWIAMIVAVTYMAGRLGREIVLCPLKRLTGLACPTCGLTRGLFYILRGDPAAAWRHNPLAFSALAVLLAVLMCRVIFGWTLRIQLTRGQRVVLWCVAAAMVLANWAYVIVYVG